jgi:hypothetical protein
VAGLAFDVNADEPAQNPVTPELASAISDYVSGMVIRSGDWKTETAAQQSAVELRRAITYLRSKAVKPEVEESNAA